ncbi:hypothetical protein LX36DRAFT_250772 [Colletotrichum falcatum]|nr:hypothetical protein LX36DRAFT_250772 [Colletotrichum falcatum]
MGPGLLFADLIILYLYLVGLGRHPIRNCIDPEPHTYLQWRLSPSTPCLLLLLLLLLLQAGLVSADGRSVSRGGKHSSVRGGFALFRRGPKQHSARTRQSLEPATPKIPATAAPINHYLPTWVSYSF